MCQTKMHFVRKQVWWVIWGLCRIVQDCIYKKGGRCGGMSLIKTTIHIRQLTMSLAFVQLYSSRTREKGRMVGLQSFRHHQAGFRLGISEHLLLL